MKIKRFIGGVLEANGYVISALPEGDADDCYIIDPGYNPKRFIEYINENKLNLKGIILTHHHSDHSGAATRIKKEMDCPVMIHRGDGDALRDYADIMLEDGDEIDGLRIIHTPGHTKGGICIMNEKDRLCFTGDTIFNVDLGRTDLGDGSDREMEATILDIIDKWPNDITIYPGHGDPATMKKVRRINTEFLDIVNRR